MPTSRSRKLISRRRRHDEDGEDEGSVVEDVDLSSASDGSANSAGEEEAEASDGTGDEANPSQIASSSNQQKPSENTIAQDSIQTFLTSSDTQAMLNGLKTRDGDKQEELQFDTSMAAEPAQATSVTDNLPIRGQNDHQDYNLRRNANPAFVPNRGGFFLHDDRQVMTGGMRGRGRGFNPGFGRGFPAPFHQPTDRQWAHDLHDTINTVEQTVANPTNPIDTNLKPSNGPNRSFSNTTVLGKINVQVNLPGMEEKKNFPNVVKKHYTLLPQHRPPLRRDKPVRISIPDLQPRYIFPSTERSFIFIPRALRPNQQGFRGGRGRGSWHGSRRTSVFGGSVYSPSIAMSRKSSIGGSAAGSGVQTPTGLPGVPAMINRPVVRMPVMNPNPMVPLAPMGGEMYGSFPPEIAPIIHSPSASLPMHQPRPQKAVSVADIESPTIKAPQQQSEQPFHQQMPNVAYGEGQPKLNQGTPLAHIPEGAVYAQPFQPYPMMPQTGYYGMPYGNAFIPPPAESMGYQMHMGGPVVHAMLPQHYAGHSTDSNSQLAHESNGMVYYYDQSQVGPPGVAINQYQPAATGGMMGMGPFFYPSVPNTVFYPQQSGQ